MKGRCPRPIDEPSKLVAGPGIEPGTRAYETRVLPLHYPAIIVMGGFGRWHHDSPAGFIERIASNQFSLPLKERTCPLLLILAECTGLEPVASCVTGMRSNQLS